MMDKERKTMTASSKPKAIVATVTGKNQITIPAVVVRTLGLEPGMKVEFELSEGRSFIMRRVESRGEKARRLQGMLRPYLLPDEDPIADLIREREEEDEEFNS